MPRFNGAYAETPPLVTEFHQRPGFGVVWLVPRMYGRVAQAARW